VYDVLFFITIFMNYPSTQLEQYRKFTRVLLFFSGGLDTSFLLRFFTKELGVEVYTVSFDLGGDNRERSLVTARAQQLGSTRHITIDGREEFVREYCYRAIKANAIYEGAHPLSSSLSRPLMAKKGVELAQQLGCTAIMHGSNGWQNNSARFDTMIRSLTRDIEIIEPVMEQNLSRDFTYQYLQLCGVTIDKRQDNLMSSDNNLWGREVEDGVLEVSDREPSPDIYRMTVDPIFAPNEAEYVTVDFDNGIPTRINGNLLDPIQLVETLNLIGGKHGIGRHDAYEDKIIGHKVREIHESPAATMLIQAHRDLQTFTVPKRTLPVKSYMDSLWTDLACFGLWSHPLREQAEAFIDKVNERVSGTVRLKLYKGLALVVGRTSPNHLMNIHQDNDQQPAFVHSPYPDRNFYDFYAYESMRSNTSAQL
jgi:argininosuccinate synthase